MDLPSLRLALISGVAEILSELAMDSCDYLKMMSRQKYLRRGYYYNNMEVSVAPE